ncbi:hypothetical protein [Flexithrix dorotheae]|uniref:hypothetical protein n=1 Tax=Flexithrix dorotheae TaxID=70993 RepID=UPI0003815C00|nr:hypothetical protein [Flexithrix dorotheae]
MEQEQPEVLYQSKYLRITKNKDIIEYHWTEETVNFTEKEYKSEHMVIGDISEKYNIEKHLVDTLKFRFIITPEYQNWINDNLFPRLVKSGTKKLAFVVPEYIFPQVSIEQTMEQEAAFQTQYFDNLEAGRKWLAE